MVCMKTNQTGEKEEKPCLNCTPLNMNHYCNKCHVCHKFFCYDLYQCCILNLLNPYYFFLTCMCWTAHMCTILFPSLLYTIFFCEWAILLSFLYDQTGHGLPFQWQTALCVHGFSSLPMCHHAHACVYTTFCGQYTMYSTCLCGGSVHMCMCLWDYVYVHVPCLCCLDCATSTVFISMQVSCHFHFTTSILPCQALTWWRRCRNKQGGRRRTVSVAYGCAPWPPNLLAWGDSAVCPPKLPSP